VLCLAGSCKQWTVVSQVVHQQLEQFTAGNPFVHSAFWCTDIIHELYGHLWNRRVRWTSECFLGVLPDMVSPVAQHYKDSQTEQHSGDSCDICVNAKAHLDRARKARVEYKSPISITTAFMFVPASLLRSTKSWKVTISGFFRIFLPMEPCIESAFIDVCPFSRYFSVIWTGPQSALTQEHRAVKSV